MSKLYPTGLDSATIQYNENARDILVDAIPSLGREHNPTMTIYVDTSGSLDDVDFSNLLCAAAIGAHKSGYVNFGIEFFTDSLYSGSMLGLRSSESDTDFIDRVANTYTELCEKMQTGGTDVNLVVEEAYSNYIGNGKYPSALNIVITDMWDNLTDESIKKITEMSKTHSFYFYPVTNNQYHDLVQGTYNTAKAFKDRNYKNAYCVIIGSGNPEECIVEPADEGGAPTAMAEDCFTHLASKLNNTVLKDTDTTMVPFTQEDRNLLKTHLSALTCYQSCKDDRHFHEEMAKLYSLLEAKKIF